MKLFIDSIDSGDKNGALDSEFVQLIERRIGEFYDVCPVQSYDCSDAFVTDDGLGVYIASTTFIIQTNVDEGCRERLANKMCDVVLSAWKEKTFVVWRKRPEFTTDTSSFDINDTKVMRLRLRIGGHGAMISPENAHREGHPIPVI